MILTLTHTNHDVAQSILELSYAAYQQEASLLKLSHFPPLSETIDSILNAHSVFHGMEQNDQLVGVIELEQGNIYQVNRLVVHPEYFRQGIGRSLLTHSLSNTNTYQVTTAIANTPAINLYESFGFVQQCTFMVEGSLELCTLVRFVPTKA
ncbi:GNAT family N-acetyltransferase [Vibrio sp. S4M6]|uniref:GNAT family N-acetyltransferase n=1 Tax=Vibrio sinus TaxID=2946865 RepID=UPI00202ABE64|nr:GNAT family N-acetyltransferase [Vibrio sinus]MCL9781640.1 GNAT family N-acetyltransferase [Vibrio sinus]